MSRYVGLCYDSGEWGGDLTGILIREDGVQIASHISSNASFSEFDIRGHYERRGEQCPGDTFEWRGQVRTQAEMDAIEQEFPPQLAPAPDPTEETR